MHGQIVRNWKIEDDAFLWEIVIPANTSATVFVPGRPSGQITESGDEAQHASGVQLLRPGQERSIFRVSSGRYHFESK